MGLLNKRITMKTINKLINTILIMLLVACNDPYEGKTFRIYEELPAATYLESRPEDFSMWIEILHYADMYNAVNQASQTFTLFVPDNEAVENFYKKMGVSSFEELDKTYVQELVKYHTINAEISQKIFLIGGKLTSPTVSGDYLSVSFGGNESGGGLNAIDVNGEARVKELAIEATNGLIYVLDAVLTPLVETLYDRLEENQDYSIFKEAVDLSGWKKRLDTPYDTVYSQLGKVSYMKKNYTLLIVPNGVFAQEGIQNVNGLIEKLGASSDYTDTNNALHKYIGYHMLSQTQYVEDLFPFDDQNDSTIIWNTLAENEVLSTNSVDGIYYINYKKSTGQGIRLVEGKTDILAKNGIIHELDDYMPIITPDPVTVIWDVCEYDDIAAVVNAYGAENGLGDCYQQYQTAEHKISLMGDEITSYQWKAYSSKSTGSWPQLGYLLTKANTGATVNTYGAYKNDMLIVNLGYMGWVSMTSPVVLKGKYKIDLYYACAGSLSDFVRGGSKCQVSIDNTSTEVYIYDGAQASVGIYSLTLFNEIYFDNNSRRTVKIVLMDPRASTHKDYRLQLDYVKFTPIID